MTRRTVANNTWTDLHPDDKTARLELRDQLRAHTRQRGISERELSIAAGYNQGWAQSIWAQESWRTSSIQRMCRALGYTLGADTVRPFPVHMALPQLEMWDALDMVIGVDEAGRDTVSRMLLADTAKRLRECLGLSLDHVGATLGQQASKVAEWETGDRPDYLFITMQRHFRALGYPLCFTLLDENGSPVPPPAPGDEKGSKPHRDRSPRPILTAPAVEARFSLTWIFDNRTVILTVDGQSITVPMETWDMFTRCRHHPTDD